MNRIYANQNSWMKFKILQANAKIKISSKIKVNRKKFLIYKIKKMMDKLNERIM